MGAILALDVFDKASLSVSVAKARRAGHIPACLCRIQRISWFFPGVCGDCNALLSRSGKHGFLQANFRPLFLCPPQIACPRRELGHFGHLAVAKVTVLIQEFLRDKLLDSSIDFSMCHDCSP
jgi:hypothetical protein